MRRLKRLALIASLAFAPSLCAADEVLNEARRHLDAGNPKAAYQLLVPLQSDRAGDPDYDFLLGSAALELGKNTEAVFALERVLAVKPDATAARALIARAYFNLKETETARLEFENVRKEDLPPEVARTVDRFLDAIRRVEDAKRVAFRGYFEVGGGYDSNVNSAIADSSVTTPLGGPIFLLPSSQRQSDSYLTFGGGVGLRGPVSSNLSVFGNVAYSSKSNIDEVDFSTSSWDLNVGLGHKRGRDTVTLAAQLNAFFVHDPALYSKAYREAVGATLQWQHDFSARSRISAYAQYAQLTYPEQQPRDADRYVGGLVYARASGQDNLVIYVGAYGGQEREADEAFPQFGHDLYGARIGAQQYLGDRFAVFVNAGGEIRRYGGPDLIFGVDREDDQYSASAGVHFVPMSRLRLTLQGFYTRNSSNIPINEFDRWLASLILRNDF